MEEQKHTPGPWKVTEADTFTAKILGPNGYPIAYVEQGHETDPEANVHLIVAAPELLEALLAVYADIELQNVKGGSDELNLMVQAAIAKVEGLEQKK